MNSRDKEADAVTPLERVREGCSEIRLQVPDHLATAWQRCSWLLVQEKGQTRLETMEEMVRDFLIKHRC